MHPAVQADSQAVLPLQKEEETRQEDRWEGLSTGRDQHHEAHMGVGGLPRVHLREPRWISWSCAFCDCFRTERQWG